MNNNINGTGSKIDIKGPYVSIEDFTNIIGIKGFGTAPKSMPPMIIEAANEIQRQYLKILPNFF